MSKTKYSYYYKGQLLRNSNNPNFKFAVINIVRKENDYNYLCLSLRSNKKSADQFHSNIVTFVGYDFSNTETVEVELIERI